MISVELFNPDKHYEAVCGWWTAQKWPTVPLSHLSGTGIVVSHDGKPAAAAWIYKTDSAYCLLEWIVASPEVRREARASALSALISSAKVAAQLMGFRSMFMTIKHESLAKRIRAQGFVATDSGMTNHVCDISRG